LGSGKSSNKHSDLFDANLCWLIYSRAVLVCLICADVILQFLRHIAGSDAVLHSLPLAFALVVSGASVSLLAEALLGQDLCSVFHGQRMLVEALHQVELDADWVGSRLLDCALELKWPQPQCGRPQAGVLLLGDASCQHCDCLANNQSFQDRNSCVRQTQNSRSRCQ
jgi:hypothetical protein